MADALKVIWPMGAELPKPAKLDRLWDDANYYAEEKIDGERGIIHVTKTGIRLTTRSSSTEDTSKPIEITHRFPQLQELNFKRLPVGTVLDSEIYSKILRPEDVAGLLNYKNSAPVPKNILHIAVFDCIYWGDESMEAAPQHARRSFVTSAVKTVAHDLVSQPVVAFDYKKYFFESILEAGGEGVILKHINGKYVQGKKPANVWVKAKKKDTFDCIITGFKPAKEGKYHGMVGSVELSQYKYMGTENGLDEYQLFVVCHASGMPDALRADMTANPKKYLGRIAVVDAAERIPNSVTLKQPRIKYIRTEGSKDPRDCII